jgi:hypothetical protein
MAMGIGVTPQDLLRRKSHLRAFGYDHGDVICLLERAELTDLFGDGREELFGSDVSVLPESFQEALLAKLLARLTEGFRRAVCIQHERISGVEFTLIHTAVPTPK